MQFSVATLMCIALGASAIKLKQDPVMDSMKDSFGGSKLEPACSKIECGAYECPTPFELKVDNTCCGYCYAPDNKVSVDRHKVVAPGALGFAVDQCEGAPSSCKGPGPSVVRCFKPSCRAGDVPNCGGGACCAACATR